MSLEALFTIFEPMPRGGPGNDTLTKRALHLLPDLPPEPVVLDLGCGPGVQTLALARELGVPITAVDVYQPFLDRLDKAAREAGLDHLITTRAGSMDELPEAEGSVDLIWSEGAIFILGFEEGLKTWRPVLKTNGLVMASEVTWLTGSPSPEPVEFWSASYPLITDIQSNLARAEKAGFEPIAHFSFPSSDWFPDFADPLAARLDELEAQGISDPDLAETVRDSRREIEVYREFGDEFGYVYYVLRKLE